MFRRSFLVAGILGVAVLLQCAAVSDPAQVQPGEQLPKELLPRTFTLNSDKITLSEALKELSKQTGNTVANRTKTEPTFALKCADLPFWKALDTIATAAHARVSLYEVDGTVALVPGPPRKATFRVSDHGLFRTTVKEVVNRLDLESGSHTCAIQLEVAWEPRLQPFLLEIAPTTVAFSQDGKNSVSKSTLPSRGRLAVTGRNATLIDVRVPAPQRAAASTAELKGSFIVIAPSKMLTFIFGKLRPIQPKGKPDSQEQKGVTVRLTEVTRETRPDHFTFEIAIDNPPGKSPFESFESWLGNNAVWLEKGAGNTKQRLLSSSVEEYNTKWPQALLRYRFSQKGNPKVRFGDLADWTLMYRTPGRLVELTVPYEFKGLPLP
jgi:hypothetical protein